MSSNQIKNNRYKSNTGQTRWATVEEIQASATRVDLSAPQYPTGGIPVMSDVTLLILMAVIHIHLSSVLLVLKRLDSLLSQQSTCTSVLVSHS